MAVNKEELLSDLRGNKRNRTVKEAYAALEAFGFKMRKAKKEASVWQKGSVTITLPNPHGGDRVLKVCYISLIVREIERAEVLATAEGGKDERND
jgi:hypothetical protein